MIIKKKVEVIEQEQHFDDQPIKKIVSIDVINVLLSNGQAVVSLLTISSINLVCVERMVG
jgi:hypothetical protein